MLKKSDMAPASVKALAELVTDSVESGVRGAQSAHGVSIEGELKDMEDQRRKRGHKKRAYAEKIAAFLISNGTTHKEDILGAMDDALNWDKI